MFHIWTSIFVVVALFQPCASHETQLEKKEYALYVRRHAFDVNAEYCNGVYPEDQTGNNMLCFEHSWETPASRSGLWESCTIPGREVGRIFLSDVNSRIHHGGYSDASGTCDTDLIATLEEAHSVGVQVYALFSVGDEGVREQELVGSANAFNENCATATGMFDGVSIMNQHFTKIRGCDADEQEDQIEFLENLQTARENALPLPTHYSIPWTWDCCSCSSSNYIPSELTWNGSTKTAAEHMIDMFDSVDVQVAWNRGSTMSRRATPLYQYWLSTKMGITNTTAFYATAYTSPNRDCRLSFAPHRRGSTVATDSCSSGDRTEAGMFAAFDQIESDLPEAKGSIAGGVFSTGMPGWPRHGASESPPPTPSPTPFPPSPNNNNATGQGHGMYAYRRGFDPNHPNCTGIFPDRLNKTTIHCFHHVWRNPMARARMWRSSRISGREIGRIFMSDITRFIQNGGYSDASGTCDEILVTTLEEAHANGVQVYALFATNKASFPEKNLVGLANDFNRNCGTDTGKFDGVAVNNEHFSSVRRCTLENEEAQLQFLQNLQIARDNAQPLPLHLSVSWNWDCCTCAATNYVKRELHWNGSTKSALEHMIDTADSIDVQVAWNKVGTMTYRASRAHEYWLANKKDTSSTSAFYVLAYINPNSDCRLSFAPHVKGGNIVPDYCVNGDRTEEGMFVAFNGIQSSLVDARGGIHSMGAVFGTGMPGWPRH